MIFLELPLQVFWQTVYDFREAIGENKKVADTLSREARKSAPPTFTLPGGDRSVAIV